MKFKITSGKRKGHTFDVTGEEITLGRKKDNHVVLDDGSVSGKHAKIYPSSGDYIVEDCGSINGIEVNGKGTKKVVLQAGDVITIGSSQITCLAEEEIIDETADAAPKQSSKKGPVKRGASLGMKIFAVLLVFAVIGLAAAIPMLKKSEYFSNRGKVDPALVNGVFTVYYEKVDASLKNIFRYEIQIENQQLRFVLSDVKEKRQLQQTKQKIDKRDLDALKEEIQNLDFFNLEPKVEGKSNNFLESSRFIVTLNGNIHEVQVINNILPPKLKSLASTLEKFVELQLNLSLLPISGEQLMVKSNASLVLAKRLFNERFGDDQNLYNSIKAFKETMFYLESMDPKPPIYGEAYNGKQVAVDELEKILNGLNFEVTKYIQLKEWAKAKQSLLLILKKLPDSDDKRYQDAQKQLMDVERRLKK